jgi:glutamate-1-semialdehyde 2,1-aminomutase
MELYKFDKSQELFARAAKVIPGGIYGHESPALTVPGAFPYYAARGEGAHYWDVDGNEFIDWMCGYGPMVLGYNHPKVEEAVTEQRKLGDTMNHPGPLQVELAELMVDTVAIADWAVFAKNGSDTTSWSVQVAREFTGRKKVLCAKGEYHGAHAWCSPGHGGIIEEDLQHVHRFEWNDIASFDALVAEHAGQIAAVITTPFHHPAFGDSVMPAPGWYDHITAVCKREGIVRIIDDVRAGFRLNLGGSSEYFGYKPDLICFSKAIANTYPLSACCGTSQLKKAASKVFLTGSFWNMSGPIAAALATIKELKAIDGVGRMLKTGTLLCDGLKAAAQANGLQILISGPPSIPTMRFANENNFLRMQMWSAECSRRGAFFHPHHNWFVSTAHTEEDIKKSLEIAGEAFRIVKQHFGG